MHLTVFAKTKHTKEGKPFNTYFSKLKKKDGEEIVVELKFRDDCGVPKIFPVNIDVDKKNANFSEKKVTVKVKDEAGNEEEKDVDQRRVWISEWNYSEEEYVDHSMDDFED